MLQSYSKSLATESCLFVCSLMMNTYTTATLSIFALVAKTIFTLFLMMKTYTIFFEIFSSPRQTLESSSLKFSTHSEEASSKSAYYEGSTSCEMGQSNTRGCCMGHIKCCRYARHESEAFKRLNYLNHLSLQVLALALRISTYSNIGVLH